MSSSTDDWADSRWMPPSPHREAVLERIAKGRCHIESQGHGKPLLLVHEDGGVLELHKVRVGSWDLQADTSDAPETVTRHVDVCATIDEIEAWLKEDPAGAEADPERLDGLLRHALAMCRRMEKRRRAYQVFAQRIDELSREMQEIVGPSVAHLDDEAEAVKAAAHSPGEHEQVTLHAEAIRDVANNLEQTLRKHRDTATELAALYEDIRGARDWSKDVADRLSAIRTDRSQGS